MTIWDDLRKGAQSVVDEGQRLTKLARLKARVKELENELGDRIYDLGTRALDLHRRNELHHFELDEIFTEIKGIQREIREQQRVLDGLAARPAAAQSTADRCPDCGRPTDELDRFCRNCGHDLKGA